MKICVVTGAGGVLCSAFAAEMSRAGYAVALLDINEAAVSAVAQSINAAGGTAKAYAVSVLDREALENVRTQILADFGKCDVLINGAGGNNPRATTTHEYFEAGEEDAAAEELTTFFNLSESGFDFVFDLNLKGVLLPTQVFARDMAAGNGGAIINISSMNAFCPLTKIPAYSGAKAAISNFTQWLAVHFSKVGIRVNAIAPGFFLTDQNRALLTNTDGSLTPRGNTILSHTPMGKFGAPEDLTGALLFLLDEEAAGFVNGIVIPVDGGFSAFSGV